MSTIDLDLDASTRCRRRGRRADPAMAAIGGVLVGLLLGWVAGGARLTPASDPAPALPSVVVVTANPTAGALAAIWLADGQQIIPPWGEPVEVVDAVEVSVFTRGAPDGSAASCSITVNGERVTYMALGAETVASCTWPVG